MATYTVELRDEADVQTLATWTKDDFRTDPAHQLNYLIRGLMQSRAKSTSTPRTMGGARRGARDKAA